MQLLLDGNLARGVGPIMERRWCYVYYLSSTCCRHSSQQQQQQQQQQQHQTEDVMFETVIPLGIENTARNRETLESIARKIDGSSVADPPPQFEAHERALLLRVMKECEPQLVISFPRLQFDREHSVFHLSCDVTWACGGEERPRLRYFRALVASPYCENAPLVLKDNELECSNMQLLLDGNPARVWEHVVIEDTLSRRDASLTHYLDHATRGQQQRLGCSYETYVKIMREFANALSPGVEPNFVTLLVDRLFQHLPVRAIAGIVCEGNCSPRRSRRIGLAVEVPGDRVAAEK